MQIETATLKDTGIAMPRAGIGTWRMGEDARAADDEISALRHAHDLGFRHFDTAEMYGAGRTEAVLGRALAGRDRDALFITSKFYPANAGREDMISACEGSLERLGMGHLDLYLLHWPGTVPFEETLEGARVLLEQGRIRAFGISNFDTDAVRWLAAEGLDAAVSVNQVMHNIPHRGVEHDLFPLLRDRGIAAVAYCPLELDPTRNIAGMEDLARAEGLTLAQLVVAWHVTHGLSAPIPTSARPAHLNDLAAAMDIRLSRDTLERIDTLAPPPSRPVPLEIR